MYILPPTPLYVGLMIFCATSEKDSQQIQLAGTCMMLCRVEYFELVFLNIRINVRTRLIFAGLVTNAK